MHSTKYFIEVSKPWFLLLASVVLLSVLFFTPVIQTMSQSAQKEKERIEQKDADFCTNQTEDWIQACIDFLERSDKEIAPDLIINAIKTLGSAGSSRAAPALIKYLDYEDKAEILRRTPEIKNGVTVITEQNDLSLTQRFPATGALFTIGKGALPALVKAIENEETDSVASHNALFVIEHIFLEDRANAIMYLEKAGIESKAPKGPERLQAAARKIQGQL